jgi:hypothetical protein
MAGRPDGVFVVRDGQAWLRRAGRLHRWTPSGYADHAPLRSGEAEVLTPQFAVQAVRAGYAPQMASR